MTTIYNSEIRDEDFVKYLTYIINQTYKLIPLREENDDWEKHLTNILVDLNGSKRIFMLENQLKLIHLLSKLEGLRSLKDKENFQDYRRNVFKCIKLINDLKEVFENEFR